jgi:hypothetical protein
MEASRPSIPPSYGVGPADEGELIPWAAVTARLRTARNYWIATADPMGNPHTTPVWGVWRDGSLFFGTDPGSRKGRNIAANPNLVAHLESGDDVVILHCRVAPVSEAALREAVLTEYRQKYDLPDDFTFAPVLAATPTKGFAWHERSFPGTATRYLSQ